MKRYVRQHFTGFIKLDGDMLQCLFARDHWPGVTNTQNVAIELNYLLCRTLYCGQLSQSILYMNSAI